MVAKIILFRHIITTIIDNYRQYLANSSVISAISVWDIATKKEAVSKVTDTASFGIILHVSLKGHIFRQLF